LFADLEQSFAFLMEVFTPDGASEEDVYGANSNSLIGSGLSLVAGDKAGKASILTLRR